MKSYSIRALFILILLLQISCSAKVNQESVKASTIIPTSAQVEMLNIPENPKMSFYYLVVEPVRVRMPVSEVEIDSKNKVDKNGENYRGDSKTSITFYRQYFLSRQPQITALLNSSLNAVKNFKVLDYEISKKNNFTVTNDKGNSKGPVLVRAAITEYQNLVSFDSSKTRVPLIYKKKDLTSKKIIGLDVSLVDPMTGSIIESFPVKSSYIYKSEGKRAGFITNIHSSRSMAQSTADQALRVAINDAAHSIYKKLSER